jgi:hypothetical protein
MQYYKCERLGKRLRPYELEDHPVEHFETLASTHGVDKLYVIGRGNVFCYVGLSRRPVASRLREHLCARHGYSWADLRDVDLYVFELSGSGDGFCEGVEAELVHLVRMRKHSWPTHQNEIHFRHLVGTPLPLCKKAAQRIFNRLTK